MNCTVRWEIKNFCDQGTPEVPLLVPPPCQITECQPMESTLSPGWIIFIICVCLICLAGIALGFRNIFPVIRRHYRSSRKNPNVDQEVEAGPSNKPSAPIEDAGRQSLNFLEWCWLIFDHKQALRSPILLFIARLLNKTIILIIKSLTKE